MKNRLLSALLAGLIVSSLFIYTDSAISKTEPNRYSLAISGGASKGAYEAGLIWGMIEVARQLTNARGWSLGGELRPLEIESIAGTSAGGINTLLSAMAWSVNPENEGGFKNRIDDNIFRDVWLSPDVNRLLPPEANSPQYLPDDAVLSRKDLVAVSRELQQKWRRPGTFQQGMRLSLGVTATRVKPDTMHISGVAVNNQRFFIPFEMQTAKDGSARFLFQPEDYPLLIDPAMILLPWSGDVPPFTISDQQIEDILLTTSAFPIGFGRKRLQYCRKTYLPDKADTTTDSDMNSEGSLNKELMCPDGYELTEAEFADGGLFDNLPIGLARKLSESGRPTKQQPSPVSYIYVDPDRERFQIMELETESACEGDNPPDACGKMTFDFASETVVLGGAIGSARKYELFRELTSDKWRLNLSQIGNEIANLVDIEQPDMMCDADLPFVEGHMPCSDRLRLSARLLALNHSHLTVPIIEPFSPQALIEEDIAATCNTPSEAVLEGIVSECVIDAPRLRKKLVAVLIGLSTKVAPEDDKLRKDIQQSALSINNDRTIHVTSRGGLITGELLGSFGAFLDYKFREFDYYTGVYDAIVGVSSDQCRQNFPARKHGDEVRACRDRLSEQLYDLVGVDDNAKGKYLFALMAKQEFGHTGALKFAYDPMPPEDHDIRIIHEGLNKSVVTHETAEEGSEDLVSVERGFFEHLKAEQFEPTPPPEGGESLLTLIMDDPEYWLSELVDRATERLMLLEKQADKINRAREPDPDKQKKSNTALMGAGALALRTATYKYPEFSFSPSTAPEAWFWRNIIPYEFAFDLAEGDLQVFWQPTWNFKHTNAGLRLGLGFTGGMFTSSDDKSRENYGILGIDFTRIESTMIFSGWGITPALYHNWQDPEIGDQTTFGGDVHVTLFKNRLRISAGVRDVINDFENTLFFTVGIADIPGLVYWMSQ